jgi:tRNA G37 N-methylase Trm5
MKDDFQKLIGIWVFDPKDKKAIEIYGQHYLEFLPDGNLKYSTLEDGKTQMIFLKWKIVGDVIVTDQPSHPKEEKSKFEFTKDGKLILEFNGERGVYSKKSTFPET